MKSTRLLCTLWVFLMVILLGMGVGYASTLTHYDGVVFAHADARVENAEGAVDDPPAMDAWGNLNVNAYVEANVFSSSVSSAGSGNTDITGVGTDHVIIDMSGNSKAKAIKPGPGLKDTPPPAPLHNAFAAGNTNTGNEELDGIYFKVDPLSTTGIPVEVKFRWQGFMETTKGGEAHLNGGFMDYMAITLNDMEMWTHEDIDIGPMDSFNKEVKGLFIARPGDIIGIYLGVDTNVNMDGLDFDIASNAESMLELTVRPVPIPGAIWLLTSGLVGLIGLGRKSRT